MALTEEEVVRSADWWLLRQGKQLRARRPTLDLWWNYYSGNHPLPQGPKKQTLAYRDFLKKTRTNFMAVVVMATVHRLQANGVADADGKPDEEANRWWQLNKLDARQKKLYRLALAQSVAYTIVGPHPRDRFRPLITVEHPREVIVESDPATGDRLAGLKAWYDTIDRVGRANVYLEDRVCKYATSPRPPGLLPWGKTTWTLQDEVPNTMGAVPVVPFECRPEVDEDPAPEFARVIEVQDRINLGMLNRMSTERYAAFKQRYVTGHKFKTKVDPATGLEVVTENPFVPDPGSLWASTGENTKFGELSASDLMGYLKSHEADIRDLLVISETPAYYYADLVNIATDTVMALDINHVQKVREHHLEFGEGLEETLGLSAALTGAARDFTEAELRWQDPRQINPAVMADAAVKKHSIGYPLSILAEDMGESPPRVERIVAEAAADALLNTPPAVQPAPAADPAARPPAGG